MQHSGKMFCSVPNTEGVRQAGESRASSKNIADASSPKAGNYVKNVAIKFEERVCDTSSQKGVVWAQRTHNMRISFSLHDNTQSTSVSVNTESRTPECSRVVTGLADNRKDRTCLRPAARLVRNSSGRSSDPLIAWRNVEHRTSPDVRSADSLSQSAHDLRQGHVEFPDASPGTVKRSLAALSISAFGTADANSVECG